MVELLPPLSVYTVYYGHRIYLDDCIHQKNKKKIELERGHRISDVSVIQRISEHYKAFCKNWKKPLWDALRKLPRNEARGHP